MRKKVSVLDVTKNLNQLKVIPIILGIIIGLLLSIVSDLTYVYVFHESSSTFYLFAGLALLGGPLIGGLISCIDHERAQVYSFTDLRLCYICDITDTLDFILPRISVIFL